MKSIVLRLKSYTTTHSLQSTEIRERELGEGIKRETEGERVSERGPPAGCNLQPSAFTLLQFTELNYRYLLLHNGKGNEFELLHIIVTISTRVGKITKLIISKRLPPLSWIVIFEKDSYIFVYVLPYF